MKSRAITQDYAKSIIDYDPETGEFKRLDGKPLYEFLNTSGYLTFSIETPPNGDRVRIRAHRLAWLIMTGEHPLVLDHINGDRIDNCWCNLRSADRAGNAWNRSRASNNKSGVKGVYLDQNGKWRCQVEVRGKRYRLGAYHDIELAELIVQEFRMSMHGEFANFG